MVDKRGEYVIPCHGHGGKLGKDSLTKKVAARLAEVGYPNFALHGLRKSSAEMFAESGSTVKELMSIFGWRDPKVALLYIERADAARLGRNAVRKLDAVVEAEAA